MKTKCLKLLAVGSLLAAASCLAPALQAKGIDVGISVSTPAVVYPDAAPPALIVEAQPVSPGPDFTWIGGSWVWGNDHRWTWEKGRWEKPPHAGARYVAHSYVEHNGRHEFHRGGWR